FVMGCQQAARSLGLDDNPMGVPFGSDASKLGRIGIPTIIFGPGSIDQAHAAVEYVELSQVENAYQFYLEVMRNLGQVSA
ncbi:MAG: M20/M25/M40 family metallo-hydrolase, partial [Pirellula sp.]|nr:M20/M25/M40 family metallo-hydrolase [Pirellula sp.]